VVDLSVAPSVAAEEWQEKKDTSPAHGYSSSIGNCSSEVGAIKQEWENLLEQRRGHASENDISPWLMKVLALSERYVSQFPDSRRD
jgi:hypothetical protein